MAPDILFCPKCGSPVQVQPGQQPVTCAHCGSTVPIPLSAVAGGETTEIAAQRATPESLEADIRAARAAGYTTLALAAVGVLTMVGTMCMLLFNLSGIVMQPATPGGPIELHGTGGFDARIGGTCALQVFGVPALAAFGVRQLRRARRLEAMRAQVQAEAGRPAGEA